MRNFLQVLAIQQLNCQHLYILQISTHVGSVIGVGQMLANQLTQLYFFFSNPPNCIICATQKLFPEVFRIKIELEQKLPTLKSPNTNETIKHYDGIRYFHAAKVV